MGIKFDSYDPNKDRPELPSEMRERDRREHPEWYCAVPGMPEVSKLTADEKREMDKDAGTRGDPTKCGFAQRETPSRFPSRAIKGDRENERPPARPDPSPFKLGR